MMPSRTELPTSTLLFADKVGHALSQELGKQQMDLLPADQTGLLPKELGKQQMDLLPADQTGLLPKDHLPGIATPTTDHLPGVATPTTVCSSPRRRGSGQRGQSRHSTEEQDDLDSSYGVLEAGPEDPLNASSLSEGDASGDGLAAEEEEGDASGDGLAAEEECDDSTVCHQGVPARKRRDSHVCTFGSHVSWDQLLEIVGDSEDAWRARRVHRWLGVSEEIAISLLGELKEVRQLLAQEKKAAAADGAQACVGDAASTSSGSSAEDLAETAPKSGGWNLFSWLFGVQARPGPCKVFHEVTACYSLDRLQELGLLGRGAYGSVTLVKDPATNQVMALKSISKGMVVEMGLEEAVKTEKAVLQSTSSPFLVKMAACFNRGQNLYFLLEAAMGGDMYTVYRSQNFFGSQVHARFYAACVLYGFEHLHSHDILYRDLKMENLVLDAKGYAKICDFGTSTFAKTAYTMCGTPEYMAPEVFSGYGHGRAADWWTLGVLIYELMMAQTPFVDEEPLQIFRNAKAGIDNAPLPKSKHWALLVKGLCRPLPAERLPMLPEGTQNLKSQEWWAAANFDWEALEAQSMPAPFVPTLEGQEDLRNFYAAAEQEEPQCLPYYDQLDGWDEGFEDPVGPLVRLAGGALPADAAVAAPQTPAPGA